MSTEGNEIPVADDNGENLEDRADADGIKG